MSVLYNFEKLDEKLTEWKFPILSKKSGFRSIRVEFNANSFQEAVKDKEIQFGKDSIYLICEGQKWKGYMYMPTYPVDRLKKMPRFHLKECKKIKELFQNGHKDSYEWSNNKLNDITDRYTKEVHPNQKLQLCNYCRDLIVAHNINDTEDFFETLNTKTENLNLEIDIYGYVKNWQKISKKYQESKKFTCESCGIKFKNYPDKRYWHTHHRDGNKINNSYSNLECLCILCHSYKNLTHRENFDIPRMKTKLFYFVNKYQKELNNLNNPYLKQYKTKQG